MPEGRSSARSNAGSASPPCSCFEDLHFKKIGIGRSATVYRVFDKDKVPTDFVIKLYEKKKDDCNREFAMLNELRHSNVIRCQGNPVNIGGRYFLVLEIMEKGSLQNMLDTQGTLSEDQRKRYFPQLLSAVEYIHGRGIVHKDIRAANCLVDKEDNLKLADFAASEELMGRQATKGVFSQTAAPEASGPGDVYGKPADIYSVGYIMYQSFGGSHLLLPGERQVHGELEFPPAVPEKARELIRKCMEEDPSLRPTATQLLQDKYWDDARDVEENWVDPRLLSSGPPVIVFGNDPSPSFIEAEAALGLEGQRVSRTLVSENVRTPTGKAGSTPTLRKHSDVGWISRARNLELVRVQQVDELVPVKEVFGKKLPQHACISECKYLKLPTSDGTDQGENLVKGRH